MTDEYINKVEVGAKIQMMYIRREMDYGGENDFCRGMRKALRVIENMPTADVQPVVYCKDCKYRKERHYEESGEKPYIKYECKFTKYSMSDDGFCSFGAKMLEKPNLQLLKDAVELIKKAKEIKVDGVRTDGDANE